MAADCNLASESDLRGWIQRAMKMRCFGSGLPLVILKPYEPLVISNGDTSMGTAVVPHMPVLEGETLTRVESIK